MPKTKDVLIGAVLMSTIFFGSLAIYSDMASEYVSLNPSLVNVTTEAVIGNKTTQEVKSETENIQATLTNIGEKAKVWDPTAVFDIIGLFVSIGTILFRLPNIIMGFIELITGSEVISLGIPSWFTALIGTIITIFFTFKILAIFLKRGEV